MSYVFFCCCCLLWMPHASYSLQSRKWKIYPFAIDLVVHAYKCNQWIDQPKLTHCLSGYIQAFLYIEIEQGTYKWCTLNTYAQKHFLKYLYTRQSLLFDWLWAFWCTKTHVVISWCLSMVRPPRQHSLWAVLPWKQLFPTMAFQSA